MITEKGTLPVGIEHDGKTHRDFELRPQIVADSVDAVENDDRAQKNESWLGLVVLAKQLVRLGDIPKEAITADLLMGMIDVDMSEIQQATGRLRNRLLSFRGESETPPQASSGAQKTGV